jgi:hypothetical protein
MTCRPNRVDKLNRATIPFISVIVQNHAHAIFTAVYAIPKTADVLELTVSISANEDGYP